MLNRVGAKFQLFEGQKKKRSEIRNGPAGASRTDRDRRKSICCCHANRSHGRGVGAGDHTFRGAIPVVDAASGDVGGP
jgi:hypothetical protein